MTEAECELCGRGPLGASRKGDHAIELVWERGGGSGLERAGDTVGAENLSSGTFSPYQMSSPHARVYIASGNKLWGNLILLEATGWLSPHSGSPVASHQAMVSPLLGVCITSSTVLNHPTLTSCPPSVKSVQQLSGFTDTAGKALWRQPCRRCMKQKEDHLTLGRSLSLVCVECPAERQEGIATSKRRTPLLLMFSSYLHLTCNSNISSHTMLCSSFI